MAKVVKKAEETDIGKKYVKPLSGFEGTDYEIGTYDDDITNLRAKDYKLGDTITGIVVGWEVQTFIDEDGNDVHKPALILEGEDGNLYRLILNRTNLKILSRHGFRRTSETDGKRITLEIVPVNYAGRLVNSIQIRRIE